MVIELDAAEVSGFDSVNLDSLSRAERYKMLTGAVIPRPIAFVTTISPNGIINAAPFSQFVIVAVDPGLLAISIGPRPGSFKDTLMNIRANGEFVINMVPEGWENIVQECSADQPADVSEVDQLGLTTMPSFHVKPPRLAGTKIQFECRLERIIELGDAPNHFVIGRVAQMHVQQGLARDCRIDPKRHAPTARIGGRNYVHLGEIVEC